MRYKWRQKRTCHSQRNCQKRYGGSKGMPRGGACFPNRHTIRFNENHSGDFVQAFQHDHVCADGRPGTLSGRSLSRRRGRILPLAVCPDSHLSFLRAARRTRSGVQDEKSGRAPHSRQLCRCRHLLHLCSTRADADRRLHRHRLYRATADGRVLVAGSQGRSAGLPVVRRRRRILRRPADARSIFPKPRRLVLDDRPALCSH